MRHQIMFLLENMSFDQHSSISLSGFKFTANYQLFNDFYNEKIRHSIGQVNSIFIERIGGVVYYDELADFKTDGVGENSIRHRLSHSSDHKSDLLKSFLNFLWLVKDNSVAVQVQVCKLIPTDWGTMWVESPNVTTAAGKADYVYFSVSDLREAHTLWEKYRKSIVIPDSYEKESTVILTTNEGMIRTRIKKHHNKFDYSKTNCLERAFHFIDIARNQEYLIYKIAFYMSAFECLFTTDSQSVTTKLRYRIALYLGDTKEERLQIDKLVKDAYDIRSSFIHGQVFGEDKAKKSLKPDILLEYSIRLDGLLRKALRKILTEDFEVFNVKDAGAKEADFHKWVYERGLPLE